MASTYPIDVVAAQQWLGKNSSLKGEELNKAVEQQKWDPSVQGLVVIPDALKRLSENIKWTTDLGDAFLAQQNEVMDAVQSLRAKAKDGGKLQTTEQQKVETKDGRLEDRSSRSSPPRPRSSTFPRTAPPSSGARCTTPTLPSTTRPTTAAPGWGAASGSRSASASAEAGAGAAAGMAAGTTIIINNNNNFVSHYNRSNNINRSGNSNWQHNAQQRGGAPYKDRATANKYGGGARGDSAQSRQSQASQRQSQGQRASTSSMNRGGSSASQVGNRNVSSSSRSSSAFGGSQSGSYARSSSSRGASSMGGMRGGGGGRRR